MIPSFQRITARREEIGGGIPIQRLLPSRQRRRIGAWCFLDHAGPATFEGQGGMHVGAHPHIGLQTFTWMIEGELLHRDSLGHQQWIRPGQVNLMSAGNGIVHTEDSSADGGRLHAVQLWIALPDAVRHGPPDFTHYPEVPRWQADGLDFSLLVGDFEGRQSPVAVHTPLMAVQLHCSDFAQRRLSLDPAFEYGLLPLQGDWRVDGEPLAVDELGYLAPGSTQLPVAVTGEGRALLIGGEPFAEELLMWWNFVGRSRDEIIQAQQAWEAGASRFPNVPDSTAPRLTPPPLPWRARVQRSNEGET